MYKRVWFCVLMVLTLSGLLFTISCTKEIRPDATITEAETEAKAKLESERQKAEDEANKIRELEDKRKMAREEALKRAKDEAERTAKERRDRDEMASKARFIRNDIYFEYDEAIINKYDQQEALKEKAEFLRAHADINVVIEGHCDERGSEEYNLALGERRAEVVKSYLMDLGISAMRMRTVTFGEEKPLESGHNEDSYSKNRRAHFEIE
jgi:peptidoglycan-associated lipoprotein